MVFKEGDLPSHLSRGQVVVCIIHSSCVLYF